MTHITLDNRKRNSEIELLDLLWNGAIIVLLCLSSSAYAQGYDDYIGAGHHTGLTATASSSVIGTSPMNTLNGSGLDYTTFEASRFLGHATLGANFSEIERARDMGLEAWIDDQMAQNPRLLLPELTKIWQEIYNLNNETFGPTWIHFNYAFWQTNMTNTDLLRQRVSYALSQIVVVSANSDLKDWGEALSSYYDILIANAFGNYKDILLNITKHPAMGYYLSHYNNPKEDLNNNIHPDENFAREIMQLFSIGLYELNQDGTQKLDGMGNPIPTYDNDDIKQLARVFTGLGPGKGEVNMYCNGMVEFGTHIGCTDKTAPMAMYGWAHQSGTKTFLGHTIAGASTYTSTSAMAEVNEAIDVLFNHPNTGPFIAYRLIQRLVTSNPSPDYVSRVSAKFNDNGQGVRGDMKAVIKAILLDQDAGTMYAYQNENTGKLREPMIRYTHISRALPTATHRGRYWNNGYNYLQSTRQHVMASPTVFNFYLPDFQPVGDIATANLVAPEFKIHNTATAVGYINEAYSWFWSQQEWGGLMYSWEGTEDSPDGAWLDTAILEAAADDSEDLINYLDKVFTHGQLTDETRQLLRNTCNLIYWTWDDSWRWLRVRMAIHLIMISPDYTCVK